MTLLLATADRPVHDNTNLAMAAFEAINDMVRNSGGDTILILGQLLTIIIQKLQAIIVPANTADHAEKLNQLQGYLCGVLQVNYPFPSACSKPFASAICHLLLILILSALMLSCCCSAGVVLLLLTCVICPPAR